MVEYPDLQGKNILEIEPKYYNNLNIDGFSKMMKSPSYCYKFYWLEAIIQLISEGKTESTFDEIIDEMIANTWYSARATLPVRYSTNTEINAPFSIIPSSAIFNTFALYANIPPITHRIIGALWYTVSYKILFNNSIMHPPFSPF